MSPAHKHEPTGLLQVAARWGIQIWQIIDIHCLSRMQLGHIFSSASFCDLMLSVAASAFAVFSSVQPSSPSHPYVAKATRMHQSERSWIRIEYNKDNSSIWIYIICHLHWQQHCVSSAFQDTCTVAWVPRPIFQTSPFFQAIAMENAVTSHESGAASEIKACFSRGSRLTVDWTDLYWCTELYWLIGIYLFIYYNLLYWLNKEQTLVQGKWLGSQSIMQI